MGRVKDKVTMVTGGVSGIGRACCLLLAREGSTVVIGDIDVENGMKLAEEIRQNGGEALFLKHDVSQEDEWMLTTDEVLRRFGRLDVLVNNAGIAITKNVEDLSFEEWHRVMAINLDGVFLGCKYGIKAMKKGGGGSIINMASIGADVGVPELPSYNASKGGVKLLTKSVALHCAREGLNIRVNSVHPGYVWTPLLKGSITDEEELKAKRSLLDSLHPIGHVGEPEDVAYGVLYLASEEAKFVTGSELVIDGGFTAR